MAGLLANLGGNPFNTPAGQKIEKATDASMPSVNWALNIEICDIINDSSEGPKDAVKAIRKRLQQNLGKNYTVVMYTLTVLETCVKNCGKRFHLLVSQKDFVNDLVKLISPKNDPPSAVQEKVLSLLQCWADAFQEIPEMQGVCQVYQDLKQKGIEFPMTDLDTMAPIYTPQRSVPVSSSPIPQMPNQSSLAPMSTDPVAAAQVSPTAVASPQENATGMNKEQLVKLRKELDVVEGNMRVFGEMLTELTPGQEHPQDLLLLNELYKTCFAMQNRIVELIDKVGVEEVTSELLRINDELNNMFLRYNRYEKKRSITQTQPRPVDIKQPAEDHVDKPLIDFGDSSESSGNDISAQLSGLSISQSGEKLAAKVNQPTNAESINAIADEFDMFAHSRTTSFESSKTRGSTYADNTNIDHIDRGLASYAQNRGQSDAWEHDMQNVSKWLEGKPTPVRDSCEDSFGDIAGRNVATDQSPVVPPEGNAAARPPALASQPLASGISNRRQMDKEDGENALFAL